MIHYLELPYARCKNCKHFDASCTRSYKCFSSESCPAKEVQLVIRDSVNTLAKQYIDAVKNLDFDLQRKILKDVESNSKGFQYKFKREVQKYYGEKK